MEKTLKEKIIEILEQGFSDLSEDEKKTNKVQSELILALFKKEVMDLSTFKTKSEKKILEEIKNTDWDRRLAEIGTNNPERKLVAMGVFMEQKIKLWQEKLKGGKIKNNFTNP